MPLLYGIIRLALGALLAIAALGKVSDLPSSGELLSVLGINGGLAKPVVGITCLVEFISSLMLIVPRSPAMGAGIGTVLMVAFTLLIGANIYNDRRPACHCFGGRGSRPIGWWTVARNCMLLLLFIVVLTFGSSSPKFSLWYWLLSFTPNERFLFLMNMVGLIMVLLCLVGMYQLFLQNGRLWGITNRISLTSSTHQEVEIPWTPREMALPLEVILAEAGAPSGDVSSEQLPGIDALQKARGRLRSSGGTILVFVDPGCANCNPVIKRVADLVLDSRMTDNVLVAVRGTRVQALEKCTGIPADQIVSDSRGEIFDAFAVHGTPAAVLLRSDPDRWSGRVSYGSVEVIALLNHGELNQDRHSHRY